MTDEAKFLASYEASAFARPSVTVDVAAFTIHEGALQVLLVERGEHPFRGALALPGGFVRVDAHEDLDAAAARELAEETALNPADVYLEQLAAFGAPDRDPRTRVITIAYYALIRPDLAASVRGGGDARAASWHRVGALGSLAFDHRDIIDRAASRIADRIDSSSIARSLVQATFTIPELRRVHEILTGKPLDPGNFRRKFERLVDDGVIEKAPGKRATASKPALVYRYV